MTDDLRQRIARIDPMPAEVPVEPVTSEASRQLLESVMSTDLREEKANQENPARRVWVGAIAAVAALVVAVGGVIAFGDRGGDTPIAASPPLELNAPANDTMASCIMFSAEELARIAEIAFEGTVTSVDGANVTLSVDTWFKGGGEAAEVVLNAPVGMVALIGGIPFEQGGQYLITAQAGTVNYCGFSGPSTPEYRAAFQQAFGG